ncbi:MAG: hypothetical protein ACXWQO_16620 [Bdellovibrionota bacterium]
MGLALLLQASPAFALKTSPSALRFEDRKAGNVLLGGEEAVLEAGEVYRTVLLLWGRLDVYGSADEVLVLSGHVVFHEGSKLTKSLVVMGGSYETLPGAEVANESVIFRSPGPLWRMLSAGVDLWRNNFSGILLAISSGIFCLFLWCFAYLLFRVFPRLSNITSDRFISDWAKNLCVGIAGAFAVPALFALLVISIFGMVLLPLYLLLLFAAGLVSYCFAVFWVGHRLLPPKKNASMRPLSLLIGVIALQLFWVSGVWWGFMPVLFLWTLGWGALIRGTRASWKKA